MLRNVQQDSKWNKNLSNHHQCLSISDSFLSHSFSPPTLILLPDEYDDDDSQEKQMTWVSSWLTFGVQKLPHGKETIRSRLDLSKNYFCDSCWWRREGCPVGLQATPFGWKGLKKTKVIFDWSVSFFFPFDVPCERKEGLRQQKWLPNKKRL